ncbi:MAG: Ig domain-containing protein [Dehalococcoidia bacterium]
MTGFYNRWLKPGLMGATVLLVTYVLLMPSWFSPATADIASTTEQFYGVVYNNDELVTSGYIITALIGANKVGETTTDSEGRYGYDPVFEVVGSPGQTVNFSLNDYPALQMAIFQGGAATELNLTCYGAPSQMPRTTCGGAACASCTAASCGISPKTPEVATVGRPYAFAFYAQGGVLPYTWSIPSGSLPPGLTLDGTLGVIKGVPTSPQVYSFTVQVNDSESSYFTLTTSIQVNPGTDSSQTAPLQISTQTASVSSNFLGETATLNVSGNILNLATEISSTDRRVRLNLAAGTVINLQGQSIIGAGNETNPPAASDGSVCLQSYSFNPSGTTFSPTAIMTLKYETPLPSGLSESSLYIAYWNGSTWTKLDSTVNTDAKEVSASVSHFTIFAIRGMPETTAPLAGPIAGSSPSFASSSTPTSGSLATSATPAATTFTFSDLTAVPEAVSPGENVTLSVRVINSGLSEATGDVVLSINGAAELHKEVTVGPGKSQPVSFALSEGDPGNYKVSVGTLSTEFMVLNASPPGEQSSAYSTVVVGIIAVGCLLVLGILLIGIFRGRPNR